MATYVVSDIHGCLQNLKDVLSQAGFNEEKDFLYIAGDIVDRGPQTWDTYLWVKERIGKSVFMILGNHEDMLMTNVFIVKGYELFEKGACPANGREERYMEMSRKTDQIFDQYGTLTLLLNEGHPLDEIVEMCEFFDSLPLYYELDVNGKVYAIVHAFCEEEIEKTDRFDIIWRRDFAERNDVFCNGKTVIYGHTPTLLTINKAEIQDMVSKDGKSEKINIDCGCVYGGKLALMRLEDRKVWYSDNTRKDDFA